MVQLVNSLVAEDDLVVVVCAQREVNRHRIMGLCLPDTKRGHRTFATGPVWDHRVGFYWYSWVASFGGWLRGLIQISIVALIRMLAVWQNRCWQETLWTLSLLSVTTIQRTELVIWHFVKLIFDLHLNTLVVKLLFRVPVICHLLFNNDITTLVHTLLFWRPTTGLLSCRRLSNAKVLFACLGLVSNWSKVANSCVVVNFDKVLT